MKLRAVQIASSSFRCSLGGGNGLWRGQVTEHELGQFVGLSLVPDAIDVFYTQIYLAGRLVRQIGIDNTLVKAQLTTIRGDLQHIVHRSIDNTGMDFGSSFGQLLHHGLLDLRWLSNNIVINRCRSR